MEKLIIATNASIHNFKSSDDKEMNRYEFVELLARIAKVKYQEPKIHPDLNVALRKYHFLTFSDHIIVKDILPNAKACEGHLFRKKEVYTLKVDEYLTKNLSCLKKLYELCVEWTEKEPEVVLPKGVAKLIKRTVTGVSM